MSLTFGTDGIRNRLGNTPLTQNGLLKLAKAIAIWGFEKYGPDHSIIICHDTRESSYWIKSVLKSSLLRYPIIVFDAQILPTSAIFQLMKDSAQNGWDISNSLKFNIGIVITASHNQYKDNGIKLIDSGSKITKKDEAKIAQLFSNQISKANYKSCIIGPDSNFGTEIYLKDAQEQYIQKIVSLFKPNFLKNNKIILDVGNGATYKVAPEIFKRLGANLIVINDKPNGKNINKNCGAVHIESLQKAVLKYKANIGFAFDGDGDRVIAVNSDGQIKNGDDFLAILVEHPDYSSDNAIVATVMSNYGLENFLKSKSKKILYTNVGDKFVIEKLQEKNLNLGGEQSGHIILRNIINTSDGILVALKIIEATQIARNFKLETFEKYPQIQINLPVKIKKDLNDPIFKKIISNAEKKLINGRILVRYSGTENYLRILVEDKNLNNAQNLTQELASNFKLMF